jgi:hypothetical protein
MLFEEIIAIFSDSYTKLINIICGQNAELSITKAGGTYMCHWILKGLACPTNLQLRLQEKP